MFTHPFGDGDDDDDAAASGQQGDDDDGASAQTGDYDALLGDDGTRVGEGHDPIEDDII